MVALNNSTTRRKSRIWGLCIILMSNHVVARTYSLATGALLYDSSKSKQGEHILGLSVDRVLDGYARRRTQKGEQAR
jgi:hypothetical protein